MREATTLGWTARREAQRYVRHMAEGKRTMCGVELAGVQVPDPPDFKRSDAVPCGHSTCQRAAREATA